MSYAGASTIASYALYSIGDGLTQQQVEAFSNALNELHQNIGRPVFE